MGCGVVSLHITDFLEERIASIFRVKRMGELGTMFAVSSRSSVHNLYPIRREG
jgi:hypothetical protein